MREKEKENNMECRDIYQNEINASIKHIWERKKLHLMFYKYGQVDDYYSETRLIDFRSPTYRDYDWILREADEETFMLHVRILIKLFEKYSIPVEEPDQGVSYSSILCTNKNSKPYSLAIFDKRQKIGFRFSDVPGEDVDDIIINNGLDKLIVILLERNHQSVGSLQDYAKENFRRLRYCVLQTLFRRYFDKEAYKTYKKCIREYELDVKKILGFDTVPLLSSASFFDFKEKTAELLKRYDYKNIQYVIYDRKNPDLEKYLYVEKYTLNSEECILLDENYIEKAHYAALIGKKVFAESFLTSEWLYRILNGKEHFDYTAIISGYLKSIEQLLLSILIAAARSPGKYRGVIFYFNKYKNDKGAPVCKKKNNYYIYELNENSVKYNDDSMAGLTKFLEENPNLFLNQKIGKYIIDLLACYRIEDRNGFFHKDNLNIWDEVERIRRNTLLLYYLLLGNLSFIDAEWKKMTDDGRDPFNIIGEEVEEMSRYSPYIYLDYGSKGVIKTLYNHNHKDSEEDKATGETLYNSLSFLNLPSFEIEILKSLDYDPTLIQKYEVLVTREAYPEKIFIYEGKNRKKMEIDMLKMMNE